jgi:serine/threonine-protein kinase
LSGEVLADRRGFLSESMDVSLVGLALGAYTIERPLGHGGMGSVWLARRTDGRFEGHAAVKLLNLALFSARGQERFRREGSVLARLTHAGIARLLDAGVSVGGQPYLVLEYIDGQRIDVFTTEHSLPRDARIRLVLQVLAAVSHAHANLVVHRDIKPSNILVTSDGTAKLLDFGIAKLIATEGSGGHAPLTGDGGRALTPEFAAPEQARGDVVTTATDVYAVGVLLYLLLSGRHPTGEGCRTSGEAIAALYSVEPHRLGLGDLDNVLAKALRKTPQDRYQTATAFADDLRHYLRHEPVSAQADSIAYRARKFVRRNRVPVIAAAVTTLGLVVATVVSLDRMREARRQRDTAVYEKRRADAQLDFQQLMLSSVGDGRVTMREIIDQGEVLLRREYSGDPRLAGGIALSLSAAYEELGDTDRQLAMLLLADSLAIVSSTRDIRLASRCARADVLAERRERAKAAALIDSVRADLAAAEPETAANCLLQLAAAEMRHEQFDSAATMTGRASVLMEQAGLNTGIRYIGVLNTQANALENLKRRREALTIYQQIATLMDSTGRGQALTRNVIRNNIGIALSNLGEMTSAEPVLRETVATFQRGSPDGFVHPAILINYCRTLLFLQRLDSAAVWYTRLHAQSVARKEPFMESEGASGMARVELARGRAVEAARWIALSKQADTRRATPVTNSGLELDAALARLMGDLPAATAAFDSLLRSQGYDSGKRTYFMRAMLIEAAKTALDAGDPIKARDYARAAHGIALSDSLSEQRSGYVGEARLLEGRALLASGDTASGRTMLDRAATALRAGVGADHPRTREAEAVLARLGVR